MHLSLKHSQAILIGNTCLPKDSKQTFNLEQAESNLNTFRNLLISPEISFPEKNITSILNTFDNIGLFEQVSELATQTKDIFIFYYTGFVFVKKQQIYLTSQSSTFSNIHLNGISFSTISDMFKEMPNKIKVFIFDASYEYVLDEHYDIREFFQRELLLFEDDLQNTYFLLSDPSLDQKKYLKQPSLTQNLQINLASAMNIVPKKEVSLKDIFDIFEKENLFSSKPIEIETSISKIDIFTNSLYQAGLSNIKEADVLFEQGKWEEALKHYTHLKSQYGLNQEINHKISVIKLIEKGQNLLKKEKYIRAKNSFKQAYKELPLPYIFRFVIEAYEYIGKNCYEQGNYELALNNYKRLLSFDKTNKIAKNKIQKIENKLRLISYIEQGDKFFYQKDYKKALFYYQQVKKPENSIILSRRKETCESFLSYKTKVYKDLERSLTEKIKKELTEKQNRNLESEKKNIYAIKQELENELHENGSKFNEAILWKNVVEWDNPIIYDFFIDLLPRSKYTQKAQNILETFESQIEAEKQSKMKNLTKTMLARQKEEKKVPNLVKYKSSIKKESKLKNESYRQTSTVGNIKERKIHIEDSNKIIPEIREENISKNKFSQNNFKHLEIDPNKSDFDKNIFISKPKTESILWQETQDKNLLEAYIYYINTTQEGKYLTEAYQKINQLFN